MNLVIEVVNGPVMTSQTTIHLRLLLIKIVQLEDCSVNSNVVHIDK